MTVDTAHTRYPEILDGVPAAQRAVEEAKEAEAAAFARVDFVREEVAVGRARDLDLRRARLKLAAAQEATGQAEARVRVLIRDGEAARVAEAARRELARSALVAEIEIEREAITSEVVPLVTAFIQGLGGLSPRARDWSERARTVPGPPPPTQPNMNPPRVGSVATLQDELAKAATAARQLAHAASTRRNRND